MRRGGRHQPRVSAAGSSGVVPQQRLERPAPPWRQRVDPQRALQPIAWMIRRVEERVDLRHGHPLLRFSDLDDLVTGADLSFPQHAEVESRPSTRREQSRHARFVHPDAEAITGDARLRDLEHRTADRIPVADAHTIVGQSFDREVLAELTVDEVGPIQLLLPVAIRFDLVDEDRALFPAVAGQVALSVSVEIQSADATAARHRILPDAGVHRAAVPLDVARKSNVYRK